MRGLFCGKKWENPAFSKKLMAKTLGAVGLWGFQKVGKKTGRFFSEDMLSCSCKENLQKRKEKIMERNQFTFYYSFWQTIENLPTNKEKLQAYQMLCGYALDGIEPDLTTKKPAAAAVFQIARPVLERAYRRAERMIAMNSNHQYWDTTEP